MSKMQTDQNLDSITQSIREALTILDDLRVISLRRRMSARLRGKINRAFGFTRSQILWLAEYPVYPSSRAEAFDIRKDQAADGGQISDEESDRLTDTDMIMRAATADGETVYIAVEASGVIGGGDISRVRQSADILEKMYSEDAIPAVYGFSIEPEQVEQAKPTDDLAEVHIFLETERF